MDMECVFVCIGAIISSLISGYVSSSRLNQRVWSGGEEIFLPVLAAIIAGFAGLLVSIVLYNAPLVVLGFVMWGAAIWYAIKQGLRKNRTKYPI